MNVLGILGLLFFIPITLFGAFLALSSCLGDSFRGRISGLSINPRHAVYDRNYMRTMTYNAAEAMEMEPMSTSTADMEFSE